LPNLTVFTNHLSIASVDQAEAIFKDATAGNDCRIYSGRNSGKLRQFSGKFLGIEYIEVAEDIASETFLVPHWKPGHIKEVPENPTAWLYSQLRKTRPKIKFNRRQLF
jgi:hypothetical protein